MRISDWSSDVCSSDLAPPSRTVSTARREAGRSHRTTSLSSPSSPSDGEPRGAERPAGQPGDRCLAAGTTGGAPGRESGGHGERRREGAGKGEDGRGESDVGGDLRQKYTKK